MFRRFAQAHAHRVAYAFGQQRTDAYGRLDAAVFTLTGLGDAQVKRIVHLLMPHLLDQQPYCLHHHAGIARLDRNDDIREMLILRYAQKLHHALYHAGRRIAITRHDAVAERTVVDAQTDSSMVLLAYVQQTCEALTQTLQLLAVLRVGVVDVLKFTGRVDIVTRIDAHFLHHLRSGIGYVGLEMDIGYQRHGG